MSRVCREPRRIGIQQVRQVPRFLAKLRCRLYGEEQASCYIANHFALGNEAWQQSSAACARVSLEHASAKAGLGADCPPLWEQELPVADTVQHCPNLRSLGFRYLNPCVQEAQADRRTAGAQGAQVVAKPRRHLQGGVQAFCPIASHFDLEHDEWQQLSPACAQKIEEQKGAKADSGPDSPLLWERELPVAEAVQQCLDLPPLGFRYPNP